MKCSMTRYYPDTLSSIFARRSSCPWIQRTSVPIRSSTNISRDVLDQCARSDCANTITGITQESFFPVWQQLSMRPGHVETSGLQAANGQSWTEGRKLSGPSFRSPAWCSFHGKSSHERYLVYRHPEGEKVFGNQGTFMGSTISSVLLCEFVSAHHPGNVEWKQSSFFMHIFVNTAKYVFHKH